MIDFTCPQCAMAFSVPDHLAGRRARCKTCQNPMTIPSAHRNSPIEPAAAAPAPDAAADLPSSPVAASPRLSPRQRRLHADAQQMRAAFAEFPMIKIRAMRGDPVDTYELDYFVRGLERIHGRKEPIERSYHCVEIRLGLDYPRLGPRCKMLTPIFHPNIEPATICVGDHWTAGERLVELCIRIGEMIAFQAYNIKSPLDGEAAMWADLHARELPIDDRNLHPPQMA